MPRQIKLGTLTGDAPPLFANYDVTEMMAHGDQIETDGLALAMDPQHQYILLRFPASRCWESLK